MLQPALRRAQRQHRTATDAISAASRCASTAERADVVSYAALPAQSADAPCAASAGPSAGTSAAPQGPCGSWTPSVHNCATGGRARTRGKTAVRTNTETGRNQTVGAKAAARQPDIVGRTPFGRKGSAPLDPVQEGEREESDLFPSLDSTIAYLRAFADAYGLHNHIRLNTEVVSTRFVDGKWKVVTRNLLDGEETSSIYDAVVYAAGLWDRRHLPAIAGIDTLPKERLLHARFYRSPSIFSGKRILILGNGNSANDIAAHAAPVALQPVYRSIRHPSYYSYVPDARIHDVKPVRQFSVDPASDKVVAELGDGTVIRDIDLVVAATGYRYDVPSLRVPSRDGSAQDEPITPSDGHRMLGLYRHMFHARFPTLAFIGYSIAWSPFANSEAQASVVARAWAGRIDVPSVEEMIKDEEDSVKEVGDHNLFHVLALYKKREYGYGNELREWALQGGVEGTVGVHWDEHRIWLLRNVVRLKTLQLQRERGLIT